MSSNEPTDLDETLRDGREWLADLRVRTGWKDETRLRNVLRAALHVLRDQLTMREAALMGDRLPLLVRGIWYEGWRPAGTPVTERSRAALVRRVGLALDPGDDAEAAARAVFALVAERLPEGGTADLRRALRLRMRGLFPG